MNEPNTNLTNNNHLSTESSSVQNYLNILQSVIARMANNSTNCKTWCVTLVSAIIVVIADKGKPNYALIALLPTILFGLLDSYYLAQERSFRDTYNKFIQKLHSSQISYEDLYVLIPVRGFNIVHATCQALTSLAIYPFYLTLTVLIALAYFLI